MGRSATDKGSVGMMRSVKWIVLVRRGVLVADVQRRVRRIVLRNPKRCRGVGGVGMDA